MTRIWFVAVALLWLLAAAVAVAVGLRGLRPGAGVVAAAEAYASEAQAREGVLVYAGHCASCHGPDLRGGAAPALLGAGFRDAWSERSVADLHRYVAGRMPPGRGGSLAPDAYAAATAYLLYRNGYPLGERALEPAGGGTGLELSPDRAGDERAALAGTLPSRRPALLARWIPDLLAGFAQDPPGEDGEGEQAQEAGQEGDGEDGTRDEVQNEDPNEEGEPAGPPPAELQRDLGDLRVTVRPDGAAVRLEGGAGAAREFAGGSRMIAGLGAGGYRLEATWQGRTLAQTLQIDPGEVVSVELVFGLDAGDAGGDDAGDGGGDDAPETIGRPGDEPAPPVDAEAAPPADPEEVQGAEAGDAATDAGADDDDAAPAGDAPATDADEAGDGGVRVPVASAAVAPATVLGDGVPAGLTLDGSRLYDIHCLACHGPNGNGGFGPTLAGNPRLADGDWVLRRILAGGLGMPSFAPELAAPEIAAVTNWIRSEFGSGIEGETDLLDVADVQRVRAALPAAQLNPARGADLSAAPIGEQRYSQLCSACHGLQGGGGVGPPLAGNPALQDDQNVITTILYGRGIMPAYAIWPDADIAAIASYVRTAWSNHYGEIVAAQVAAYRPEGGAPPSAPDDSDEAAADATAAAHRPQLRATAGADREDR